MQFLEQVANQAWAKHCSPITIRCYRAWLEQFLRFIRYRKGRWIHPMELRASEVEMFLTHLAVERRLAALTQNQALNAMVFNKPGACR